MRNSFIAFVLLLVITGPVRAQDAVTLLVRERGTAPRDLVFVTQTTADMLNKKKGILADVPARPLLKEDLQKAREQAAGLVEEARELYRKFDEKGALSKLGESRAALIAGCGGADSELLRSQELLEGMIHFTAGRRDAAQLAFSRLAALDPAYEPDPAKVAPKVVAAFREARDAMLKKKPGLLDLSGRPAGARVLLDGKDSGSLPAVFDRVPPGNHCLEVRDPAHGAWVARLTMPSGGTVRMRAILFPNSALSLLEGAPGLPGDVDPGELARGFTTDYLALGDAEASGVTLRLISARNGKVSKPITCPVGQLENLPGCLQAGLKSAHKKLSAPPAVVDLGPPSPPPPVVQPEGSAWYESWWFWTIVGGVALAGTALTLGIMLSPDADNPDYWVTVTRP